MKRNELKMLFLQLKYNNYKVDCDFYYHSELFAVLENNLL